MLCCFWPSREGLRSLVKLPFLDVYVAPAWRTHVSIWCNDLGFYLDRFIFKEKEKCWLQMPFHFRHKETPFLETSQSCPCVNPVHQSWFLLRSLFFLRFLHRSPVFKDNKPIYRNRSLLPGFFTCPDVMWPKAVLSAILAQAWSRSQLLGLSLKSERKNMKISL